MSFEIIKEKTNQAVEILKEKNIDMWITFVRETGALKDPVMDITVGNSSTWQSAFIINKDGDKTAIVGQMELENFVAAGVYKNVTGYVKSIREPLVEYITKKNPQSIAINYSKNSVLADGLTYGMYQILLDHLEGTDFINRLISAEEVISALRGRKSKAELALMKHAADETLKIFDMVTSYIKPGLSELDVANYVKSVVEEKGYELAWEETHCPAVFTGPDPAGPHSGPTERKIEKGHMINMDFGIKLNGYCSDIQRTWYVLNDNEIAAPEDVQKGFEVICDAIQMVADALKPGVKGVEMDDIARNYITQQGYEEYPHGLGHQLGRSVHDGGAGLFPRWEKYGRTPYMPLEEGQIFTIEPRLPVKGYGVSTIEEEVVITKDGCEFITKPQQELIIIRI
ncbi:MAG TPA: Xaa-Pro peptidase family protein [Ignavibacteriaceae bacterium]|nr:Xaa-Pro peptidase family protein [Ignavibacteriaceae bacterium]